MDTAALEARVKAQELTIAKLEHENTDMKGLLDIEKAKVETLEAELNSTLEVNKALTLEVERISTTSAEPFPSKSSVSADTFELAGKTYGFAYHATIFHQEKITADEVLASKDLQQELVDLGSGFIYEL